MNNVIAKRTVPLLRRRGAVAAMLALAVLGSAGFAAAGGVEMVKGWIFTVELSGVNGNVTVDLEKVDIQSDGQTATITLDADDIDVDGEVGDGATVTITATQDGTVSRTVKDGGGQ